MTMLKEELVSHRAELESYLETDSIVGIVLIDSSLNILDCNQGFTKMFQLRQKPLGSSVANFLTLGDKGLKYGEELTLSCRDQSGVNGIVYCRTFETEKGCLLLCERLILTESQAIEQIGALNNELINLQRESVKKNLLLQKLKRELDERIAELETTLSRVKQLEGIIPICSYCKKIRDKQADWHGLEKYITEHSEARFTHGICPDCFKKLMEA